MLKHRNHRPERKIDPTQGSLYLDSCCGWIVKDEPQRMIMFMGVCRGIQHVFQIWNAAVVGQVWSLLSEGQDMQRLLLVHWPFIIILLFIVIIIIIIVVTVAIYYNRYDLKVVCFKQDDISATPLTGAGLQPRHLRADGPETLPDSIGHLAKIRDMPFKHG